MKSDTRMYVYLLVIDDCTQVYISKVLNVSRQAVNYHIKNLQREGYIRPLRGTNPIIYKRTRKILPGSDHRGWSDSAPIIRAHHTVRKFSITTPPSRPWGIFWDREWSSSGVHHNLARDLIISTSEGDIKLKTLRLTTGKRKSSLTVWLHKENIVSPIQIEEHEATATEISLLVANELARRSGARFALPEMPEETHYALEVPGVWIDRSTGRPELETSMNEVVLTWLTLPTIIKGLKDDIEEIRKVVVDIVGIEQKVSTGMLSIKDALENINDRVRTLEGNRQSIDSNEVMFQ